MQVIRNFSQLTEALADCPQVTVAVAYPHDDHTVEAIAQALDKHIAKFILVGDAARLSQSELAVNHPSDIHIVDAPDSDTAARMAVELVGAGKADVLMKGKLNTDNLLRAVLNKEWGILPKGNVLSHVTVSEIPGRDKLLIYGDVAVIPCPTLDQRRAMIGYLADVARTLGCQLPRIALTHFTEKVNPKFPVSTDYVELRDEAIAGRWGSVIVDGPMDIATATDPDTGRIKGIDSPIQGQADCLMMADIEAGNVFYKTLTHFGHATNAGMLVGAKAPVVVPSRGDSAASKLASLALACLMAAN